MHLVVHTQYYPPEVDAPQARLSALASEAALCGHRVTVLTAMPNYPSGKVQPGYGGLVRRDRQGDVTILLCSTCATQKARVAAWLLSEMRMRWPRE